MKKIIVLSTSFLLIFSFLLVDVKEASACSYIAQTPAEKFADADVVFLGEVTRSEGTPATFAPLQNGDTSTTVTTFYVSKYWKGDVSKGMSVYSSHVVGTSCASFVGEMGEEYLVYADYSTEKNRYEVTEVGAIRSLDAEIAIESFGSGRTPEMDLDKYMVKYDFSKNLSFGMKGSDVQALQMYLNSKGFKVAIVGPGSPGSETSYFGPATKAALIKFQIAKSITPAVGFFGPITRGVVNGN